MTCRLQLLHEIKIFLQRVHELFLFQPLLLKLSNEGIIKNEVIVIEGLKLFKAVAVLGDTDFVYAALLCRIKKSLHPCRVIGTVLKMHVIIKSHTFASRLQFYTYLYYAIADILSKEKYDLGTHIRIKKKNPSKERFFF